MDVTELFPVLADSSDEGASPRLMHNAVTDPTGENGLIGFSFKDSLGKVILPTLTAAGKVPVDTESVAGVCKTANGELAAGSLTLALVTGAKITLVASKVYTRVGVIVSSLRSALFQLVAVEDVGVTDVETLLGEFVLGPGQYTLCCDPKCLEFTAGTTGVLELQLKAKNFAKASSIRGTIFATEVA